MFNGAQQFNITAVGKKKLDQHNTTLINEGISTAVTTLVFSLQNGVENIKVSQSPTSRTNPLKKKELQPLVSYLNFSCGVNFKLNNTK